MKAMLVLEDGTYFEGVIGRDSVSDEIRSRPRFGLGQIVLNTAVVGYQEMMTDPANAGKLLVLTYPLIGNYGVNEKFNESERVWVNGLVIKEKSSIYSNWQADSSLGDFLKKEKVVAISGVDTRTLAVKIRDDGEMLGIISSEEFSVEDLLKRLMEFKKKERESVLSQVSVKEITRFEGKGQRVVVIDLGILKSTLRQLSSLGLEVILVPYDTEVKEILKLKPKGVIISNGPEDDPGLSEVIDTIKEILGKVPLLGISTGHQVIAEAIGAKVTKMKVGHHGVNYPVNPVRYTNLKSSKAKLSNGVKNPDSLSRPVIKIKGGIPLSAGKGEITVQNHSFIVDEDSLNKKDIEIVERNINDHTIEKMRSKKFKFISVQYYPASPGLNEIHPVFNEFISLLGG